MSVKIAVCLSLTIAVGKHSLNYTSSVKVNGYFKKLYINKTYFVTTYVFYTHTRLFSFLW